MIVIVIPVPVLITVVYVRLIISLMIQSRLVSLIVAVVLVVFVLSAHRCCSVLNVRMVMLPYSLVLYVDRL